MKHFRCEIPLRWADMDAMQHVNNVSYFRLFEEARVLWMAQLGATTLPGRGAGILARISCDFQRPLTYPATVVVDQRVQRLGRSSVELSMIIERADEPGVAYASGQSVIVWFDYEAGVSAPWPEALRVQMA